MRDAIIFRLLRKLAPRIITSTGMTEVFSAAHRLFRFTCGTRDSKDQRYIQDVRRSILDKNEMRICKSPSDDTVAQPLSLWSISTGSTGIIPPYAAAANHHHHMHKQRDTTISSDLRFSCQIHGAYETEPQSLRTCGRFWITQSMPVILYAVDIVR